MYKQREQFKIRLCLLRDVGGFNYLGPRRAIKMSTQNAEKWRAVLDDDPGCSDVASWPLQCPLSIVKSTWVPLQAPPTRGAKTMPSLGQR